MMEHIKTLEWVFLLQENVTAPLVFTNRVDVEHEQGMPWSRPYDS
jgi:hypothetical protein